MTRAIDTAREWIKQRRAELPLPGSGDTQARWHALRQLARENLPAARVVEAHTDAAAICAELSLNQAPEQDSLWAVWAAEPPSPVLHATCHEGQWQLTGTKPWCSGAGHATHALVTARAGQGSRLFAVDLNQTGVSAGEHHWASAGMADTATGEMHFDDALATTAGTPTGYLERPGFWHGGLGVANCWWGGAQGLLSILRSKVSASARLQQNPHTMAHLGACLAWDATITGALNSAAQDTDAAPTDTLAARRRAFALRSMVERACTDVIQRFGRALGAHPFARNDQAANLVQDLQVYIRQSHADSDDAELARLALADAEQGDS
ncbi:acyl-CoA dehydrogenase family protein [Nesterenkonia salmonea]|uniref:Acyl-CoA dehydrogenase family protein n=1 Tax=Nesterenkonia salmonea TaxID=1804987 RepID=A0A5R9BAA5_9MICC|nr:acyl-CoA dehydrogenase family protein [Nesterenkonia salmonea]TLP96763.1 acyl-CoA dehydrogenase family protein [Nesterenkonia salmonea]